MAARKYLLWYFFSHRVENNWDKTRIYLVINLIHNDKLRALFTQSFLKRTVQVIAAKNALYKNLQYLLAETQKNINN